MIRKVFVMSANTGAQADYARSHPPIWPELQAVLNAHSIHTYSIFLLEGTRQLFAISEIDSESPWAAIAKTPVCQRWRQHMRNLMLHNSDGSAVAEKRREVLHLGREVLHLE
jgi:L-rhamnose mutarotase